MQLKFDDGTTFFETSAKKDLRRAFVLIVITIVLQLRAPKPPPGVAAPLPGNRAAAAIAKYTDSTNDDDLSNRAS
jgi:hypothetical protein